MDAKTSIKGFDEHLPSSLKDNDFFFFNTRKESSVDCKQSHHSNQKHDSLTQVWVIFVFGRFRGLQNPIRSKSWQSRRGNSNITTSIIKNRYCHVTSKRSDPKVEKV